MIYLTIPLATTHNRNNFSCGKKSLDSVSQDIRENLTACFVLSDKNQNIIGYYTLSSDNVPKGYKNLPATLLGRLAVDIKFKGQGIGRVLLIDGIKRAYYVSQENIGLAVLVDPLDEEAVNFYLKFGFILLPDSGRMFLPMELIAKLF
jgi:predicted N-acetyltransferase YhbS